MVPTSLRPGSFVGIKSNIGANTYRACIFLRRTHWGCGVLRRRCGARADIVASAHELARPTSRRRDGGFFRGFGPDHIPTVDPAQFPEAMSQLGAAVHVVTTAGPAGMAGFTATAVVRYPISPRPAGLPQPAQPGRADPAREPGALRQYVARRRRHDRRRIRRTHERADGAALR